MNPGDLGDLTDMVAHEINNLLNSVSLQLALIDQQKPAAELRPGLGIIREAARNAAAMIRRLQEFSQRRHAPLGPMDVNAVVLRATGQDCGPIAVVRQLSPDLPPVLADDADLERLINFLLAGSVAAIAPEVGTVTFRTEAPSPDRVSLRVEDTGAQARAEDLPHFFQPFVNLRRGGDGISPALCKAIVRRFRGTIHAENRPEGGMVFTVELRTCGAGRP